MHSPRSQFQVLSQMKWYEIWVDLSNTADNLLFPAEFSFRCQPRITTGTDSNTLFHQSVILYPVLLIYSLLIKRRCGLCHSRDFTLTPSLVSQYGDRSLVVQMDQSELGPDTKEMTNFFSNDLNCKY